MCVCVVIVALALAVVIVGGVLTLNIRDAAATGSTTIRSATGVVRGHINIR